MPLSCWIRNFESVVRPRSMGRTPSVLRLYQCCGNIEDAAGADVGLGDGRQIIGRELLYLCRQKSRLACRSRARSQSVAHTARIGHKLERPRDAMHQVLFRTPARAQEPETMSSTARASCPRSAANHPRGSRESPVVMRNARAHAGVGAEEGVHSILCIPPEMTTRSSRWLLHVTCSRISIASCPVVALILGAIPGSTLTSIEQHAAHRLHFRASLVFGAGVPDVLADEVIAASPRDEVAFAHASPSPCRISAMRKATRGLCRIPGLPSERHVRRLGACRLSKAQVHAQLRRSPGRAAMSRMRLLTRRQSDADRRSLEVVDDRTRPDPAREPPRQCVRSPVPSCGGGAVRVGRQLAGGHWSIGPGVPYERCNHECLPMGGK